MMYRNLVRSGNRGVAAPSAEAVAEHIDRLLERDVVQNKADTWTRLNKTVKLEKLMQFADAWKQADAAEDDTIINTNINNNNNNNNSSSTLGGAAGEPDAADRVGEHKRFLAKCLNTGHLLKTKEVVYNKSTQSITDIPGLQYAQGRFSLRSLDPSRTHTLLSLTPHRTATTPLPASASSASASASASAYSASASTARLEPDPAAMETDAVGAN